MTVTMIVYLKRTEMAEEKESRVLALLLPHLIEILHQVPQGVPPRTLQYTVRNDHSIQPTHSDMHKRTTLHHIPAGVLVSRGSSSEPSLSVGSSSEPTINSQKKRRVRSEWVR